MAAFRPPRRSNEPAPITGFNALSELELGIGVLVDNARHSFGKYIC